MTFAQIRDIFEASGWQYVEEFSHGVGIFAPVDPQRELYLTVKTIGTIRNFGIIRGDNKADALSHLSDYDLTFRVISPEQVRLILVSVE